MNEVICPHCHTAFKIDEARYADILKQVRDKEFDKQLHERLALADQDKRNAVELAEAKLTGELQREASAKDAENKELKAKLDAAEDARKLAVAEALSPIEKERNTLANDLAQAKRDLESASKLAEATQTNAVQKAAAAKDAEIQALRAKLEGTELAQQLALTKAVSVVEKERDGLKNSLERVELEKSLAEKSLTEKYETQLKDREDTIDRLKDMKAKLSTKMIGESLEQHCETEFNRIRATAFPHAYFEKDNDARSGSKGDFIFRDLADDGTEIVSIMFEMKNEGDETASKKKNEDFLKELDKDRTEKDCEYAVLVSLLEPESELYNTGIVDVFHRYPKMYVVRPQFFIPIITLLRNAAMKSLAYRSELALVRAQNVDITRFETQLGDFKTALAACLRRLRGGHQADRRGDQGPGEDQGRAPQISEQPAACERQGRGSDDQEIDPRQPDDGGEVCRTEASRCFRRRMNPRKYTMEKLKMHSPDLAQDNIARIRELFPDCVTEGPGEDGGVRLAVDFDQLRQALSESLVEGPQERYQLNWPGKREALLTANAPIAKTLRPCREESVDFDTAKNLFIEGDNLEALKLLQETYLGKVKMIYIDPPYNTGNDFIYEDDFAEDTDEYLLRSNQVDEQGISLNWNTESNGRFHSNWLSMIYSRLRLARNLLKDDGSIFISIDDKEVANLRKVCDEVFGASNFVANIVWQSRTSISDDHEISLNHNHTLIFAKEKETLRFYGEELDATEYQNRDNDKRGPWKLVPLDANKPGGNTKYPILNPSTGQEHWPPEGRSWAINPTEYKKLFDDGRIAFGLGGDSAPKKKLFLDERIERGDTKTPSSVLLDAGTTKDGSAEVTELFGRKKIFSYPKPTSFLERLVQYGVYHERDQIVLDFFSGSSTTAHAVMKKNAEDDGNRRFIMVQLPEACAEDSEAFKAGYKTIAEVSKERIRRAGTKISESNPQVDTGFRVLKIDTSNMADVYYTPDAMTQEGLFAAVDNIKPDRTAFDLLFQVMLDWGVDLALPIERKVLHIPAASSQQPAASSQQPAASSQQPAASSQQKRLRTSPPRVKSFRSTKCSLSMAMHWRRASMPTAASTTPSPRSWPATSRCAPCFVMPASRTAR